MSAPTIRSLPLDAWAIVMLHADDDIVGVFERVYASDALAVPPSARLDAFWLIASLARMHRASAGAPPAAPPDAAEYRHTMGTLTDLGVARDVALRVTREARGEFATAIDLLGWD